MDENTGRFNTNLALLAFSLSASTCFSLGSDSIVALISEALTLQKFLFD